ncbi:MAG TPA: GNAT family N-acetyltransferase [Fimbriimonadaceae bacterium]|nr:GNAT family N-acetyltransferase [Fimbriimonadaceae bacterium]
MTIHARDHLETLFILDGRRRILSTREPNPSRGPAFILIRRADTCAWSIGAGIGDEQAREVTRLALDEHPTADFRRPPKHLEAYLEILGGEFDVGPAFEFPEFMPLVDEVAVIEDAERLQASFNGWTADELSGRSPIMAVVDDGVPVSICFCARASASIAEAGVETAPEFRGRGIAGLVTAAWATAIQASGRTPIYSTSWRNGPSLAVARKLGLVACASYWNLLEKVDARAS